MINHHVDESIKIVKICLLLMTIAEKKQVAKHEPYTETNGFLFSIYNKLNKGSGFHNEISFFFFLI
jgi:hypothetical protein